MHVITFLFVRVFAHAHRKTSGSDVCVYHVPVTTGDRCAHISEIVRRVAQIVDRTTSAG